MPKPIYNCAAAAAECRKQDDLRSVQSHNVRRSTDAHGPEPEYMDERGSRFFTARQIPRVIAAVRKTRSLNSNWPYA